MSTYLELLEAHYKASEAVLQRFRELEWARGDWQGFCPFRQHPDVRCTGTDGQRSAFGSATPRPHVEACPYHHLNQLEKP